MAWAVEFERSAARELDRLDREVARRILRFLSERVLPLDDPRVIGEPMKGSRYANLWRYRVGDHRLIVAIEDERVRILVVRIGHRRQVHRATSIGRTVERVPPCG